RAVRFDLSKAIRASPSISGPARWHSCGPQPSQVQTRSLDNNLRHSPAYRIASWAAGCGRAPWYRLLVVGPSRATVARALPAKSANWHADASMSNSAGVNDRPVVAVVHTLLPSGPRSLGSWVVAISAWTSTVAAIMRSSSLVASIFFARAGRKE